MNDTETDGRFLPSRVYKRWTWSVRCGLMVVPALVFLSGGIALFFTPNLYRSTAVLEFRNGPPTGEIVELLKSEAVLERASREVNIDGGRDIDFGSAMNIVQENLTVETVQDTGFIRISVALADNEMARDIVAAIPRNVIAQLAKADDVRVGKGVARINNAITEAADFAEEKHKELVNHLAIHGADPADAGEAALLNRARNVAAVADGRVEELVAKRLEFVTDGIVKIPELLVHTAPRISETADSPRMGSELGWLSVRSLLYGLATALLLPYLLELIFPPQREAPMLTDPVADL